MANKPKPIEDMFKDLTTKQKMISLGNQLIQMIKERTIKEIIEKVTLWRKLYRGIPDPNNAN